MAKTGKIFVLRTKKFGRIESWTSKVNNFYLYHFDESSQGISARERGCHSQVPEMETKLKFLLLDKTNLS